MRQRGFQHWLLGVIALSIVFSLMGGLSSAEAAETHAFDAELSLTGNCSESPLDPVPDPGCPGGVHPNQPFSHPQAVAVDAHGNIYVASFGKETAEGSEGRIDIFDSEGSYIAGSEIADPAGPVSLAVDSNGVLYVFNAVQGEKLVRYTPTTYEPGAGNIVYNPKPTVIVEEESGFFEGMAINRLDDHLFLNQGYSISEFGTAAEGNPLLDSTIGQGILENSNGIGMAVDAAHNRIYASDRQKVRVFQLSSPHNLLLTIEGSSTPGGPFENQLSVAVDEGTGNFFVFDAAGATVVYEFDASGKYLATIDHSFQYVNAAEIAVDNGEHSPNAGYLYVPSHPSGVGHVFAFGPPSECAPQVQETSAGQLTQSEAVLRAEVNPCGLQTTYSFQYTTRQRFEAEGFALAQTVGGGTLAAAGTFNEVSAAVSGLAPSTEYVFRIVATNAKDTAEDQGSFTTYPGEAEAGSCPNEALRTGASALLPDCRAYELVTPPDTNAHTPHGLSHLGIYFATREVSPIGEAVSFQIEGGLIPGADGTGALAGDPYLARRTASGWSTTSAGPTGVESEAVKPGSTSPDQGYSFWGTAGGGGTAARPGVEETTYVRYPAGDSALIGRGSIATDPEASGKLISTDGSHIIFLSANLLEFGSFHPAVQLEPNAPPDGTQAIYDRTPDEVTHVVSLLPGNETPEAGEDAEYTGASLDGKGVAFSIGSTLYLRYDNAETYEIGKGITFADVAEGGNRIFYLDEGRLLRFDALTQEVKAFNTSGAAIPVNVSADGSAAYFVSTSVLTTKTNPHGANAKAGQQNLYLSREGVISFVGTVTSRDVEGDTSGNEPAEGLGLWITAVSPGPYGDPGRFGEDPSRTTPDGSVLLFESRASLTGYDSEGHNEVYRYDSVGGDLTCLSCNPVGAAPTGFASLESITQSIGDPEPFSSFVYVANLRPDGRRAFFQSTEALVSTDTDGLQDVYEWEAQGVGSCGQAQGCLYLISSGHSSRTDYLYGVSDSGDDVFFRSSDRLVPRDSDETPSIYDARVGGGFPEAAQAECQGEGCRSALPAPPPMIGSESAVHADEKKARRCLKGKRRLKRHGKVRCVNKHHHRRHHHHRRASSNQKGAGK